MTQKPNIVVHGGAWGIPNELKEAHRLGVETALQAGEACLNDGGSALDAVQCAVAIMEDDPTFDAGRGGFLNVDGYVELDAGIMNGENLDVGAVAAARGVKNPVHLARAILDTKHCLIVGNGATSFAEQRGIEQCDPDWHVTPAMRALYEETQRSEKTAAEFFDVPSDTVGAVAIDQNGDIAAATSTGGTPDKPVGRVGDSPIAGAGYYADNLLGAASSTGWGEGFFRLSSCYRTVAALAERSAMNAARLGIDLMQGIGGRGGMIVIDRNGAPGVYFNTPAMAYAYRDEAGVIHSSPDQ